MNALRARLEKNRSDAGLGLVEIVVAMMIFALISTGVLYTMINVLSVERDSRTRQVAANLAAEEIDRSRAIEDIAKLVSWTTRSSVTDPQDSTRARGPVRLNNDVFHIQRTVAWVSDSSSGLSCGASSAGTTLRYKRINVEVTWEGMRGGTDPVRADTAINPRAPINDPTKGTILIYVKDSASIGAPGVTVTSSPSITIAPTDVQGCTYIFRVNPGTYTIGLSKTDFVDNLNAPNPTRVITVGAGKVENREFQYDKGIRYNFTYPSGFSRPSTFQVSAIDTNRTFVTNAPANQLMHPTVGGYTFVAGDASICPAFNPSNWSPSADGQKQVRAAPVYQSKAGLGAQSVPIPMGTLELNSSLNVNGNRYIRAVSTTGSGHPACASEMTLNFPQNQKKIALPYGTWKLYVVNGGSVTNVNLSSILGGILGGIFGGSTSSNVLTVDPRVAP